MNANVLFETDGPVATVTFNRPEARNALTPQMLCELADAFAAYEADDALRALVVTGAGSIAFCAGGDLAKTIPLLTGEVTPVTEWDRRLVADPGVMAQAALRERAGVKPIICAVNGACMAGGFELMLGTDIRIAAIHARFALPEVTLGVLPFAGSMTRLPRQIPYASAMYLLLSGEPIDAAEALRVGLVNEVVPANDVLPRALTIAQKIAGNASVSVREIKRTAVASSGVSLMEAYRLEDEARRRVLSTQDAREGPRAFMQKRKPTYRGR